LSDIQGGFDALVYTSSTKTGSATNVGIATRVNPITNPGNIDVPGTGRRGLYDILLGTVEPIFNMDFRPTAVSFIDSYQDGQTAIPFLHLKSGSIGITFTNVYINTISVEQRVSDALQASAEMWAEKGEALASASWGAVVTTPYRWLDTTLDIGGVTETEWHMWRYEVNNNLQRLANVATRGTREIVGRNRTVSGQIQKDLRDYDEFIDLMDLAGSEPSKFNITIDVDGTDLLNKNCRWGRIEAPAGPEDLVLKRFPFTALDLT